jgi:hypothetical protein
MIGEAACAVSPIFFVLKERRMFRVMLFGLALIAPVVARGADAPKLKKTAELAEVPVSMTVKQRSTTVVPGSNDVLQVTIDDITAGQVMVTISKKKGDVVLPLTSLRSGETKTFKLGRTEYQLKVKALRNQLIGDDFADLELGLAPDGKSEPEKIEKLLAALESLDNAKFIRNEKEYSIAETVDHLRIKWKAADDEVTTAEQFIEHVASKSSVSGKPYVIRLDEKTVVPAGVYLRARLREIEKAK